MHLPQEIYIYFFLGFEHQKKSKTCHRPRPFLRTSSAHACQLSSNPFLEPVLLSQKRKPKISHAFVYLLNSCISVYGKMMQNPKTLCLTLRNLLLTVSKTVVLDCWIMIFSNPPRFTELSIYISQRVFVNHEWNSEQENNGYVVFT